MSFRPKASARLIRKLRMTRRRAGRRIDASKSPFKGPALPPSDADRLEGPPMIGAALGEIMINAETSRGPSPSHRRFRSQPGSGDVPMMNRTNLSEQHATRWPPFTLAKIGALVLLLVLAACQKEEKAAAAPTRPVRTVTVELQEGGEKVSLTGEIQPRYQADLGFRVNGKILERPVDVGTEVKKDDLLARLDPQQYRQDLEVAKAEVVKAEAEVARSQAQEYRQRELLKNGHTTQVAYDQALKTFKTAQAEADATRARQVQASENLGYTELRADNNGVIDRKSVV